MEGRGRVTLDVYSVPGGVAVITSAPGLCSGCRRMVCMFRNEPDRIVCWDCAGWPSRGSAVAPGGGSCDSSS